MGERGRKRQYFAMILHFLQHSQPMLQLKAMKPFVNWAMAKCLHKQMIKKLHSKYIITSSDKVIT
jgi:hypothetical protein